LNVLIADDELNIRRTIGYCLTDEGHTVSSVGNAADAQDEASSRCFDLVFLDLRLGKDDGMELIPKLLATAPWLKIVVITAHASIESAVEAIRLGAVDYVQKPFTADQIILLTKRIQKLRSIELELASLREQTQSKEPKYFFSSSNSAMKRVLETARKAAASDAIVVLRGESGTGKSVLAKAIHQWSPRSNRPFTVVSCPAVPSDLLESELFGHVRGAFTGAAKDNPGRIALAEGGTLFLDEIADMPRAVQAKILQLIQDKSYNRVGDPAVRTADVRIIAAANADLEEKVKEGTFREDLFYRLSVISIEMPPLRKHKEDIIPLAQNFLAHFSAVNHKHITEMSKEAEQRLIQYSWPGNIRELRNTIERAVILGSSAELNTDYLPFPSSPSASESDEETACISQGDPSPGDPVTLEALEKIHIKRVLARANSIQEAASILGIDQATLWRKRKAYHLT